MPDRPPPNILDRMFQVVFDIIDKPVTIFREKIVEPNQQNYPWYHQRFRRVPTIDECYVDDVVCQMEAQYQFLRDRRVDMEIINILRYRYDKCFNYHNRDKTKCIELYKTFMDNMENFRCKYDNIVPPYKVREAFMKQKHRLIWERTHGTIGKDATKYA